MKSQFCHAEIYANITYRERFCYNTSKEAIKHYFHMLTLQYVTWFAKRTTSGKTFVTLFIKKPTLKTSQHKQFCTHIAAIICTTIHGTASMNTKLFFSVILTVILSHKSYYNCLREVVSYCKSGHIWRILDRLLHIKWTAWSVQL